MDSKKGRMKGPEARSILPSANAITYLVPVWPSFNWMFAMPRSAAFSTKDVADNAPAVPAPAALDVKFTCAQAALALSTKVAATVAVVMVLSIVFSLKLLHCAGVVAPLLVSSGDGKMSGSFLLHSISNKADGIQNEHPSPFEKLFFWLALHDLGILKSRKFRF